MLQAVCTRTLHHTALQVTTTSIYDFLNLATFRPAIPWKNPLAKGIQ